MQQFPAVPLSQKASLAMKFSLPTSENCPKVVQFALTQYPNTKYPPVLYIYLFFLHKRTAFKSILESISTVPGGEVRLNNESPSSSTPPPLNQRICVSSGTLSNLHTVDQELPVCCWENKPKEATFHRKYMQLLGTGIKKMCWVHLLDYNKQGWLLLLPRKVD